MVYGYMFYFDQPVKRVWYTYGRKPALAHWEDIVHLAKTKPTEIPNEVYNFIAGAHCKVPMVQVSSTYSFQTPEEAEAWVDKVTQSEIDNMVAQHVPPEAIREAIINVDHVVRTIRRMRSALTVNAGLYYDKNETAIEDWRWDEIAYQLVDWHKRYHYILPYVNFFDFEFMDFDGSTGFDLPYRTQPFVNHIERAMQHLDKHRKL